MAYIEAVQGWAASGYVPFHWRDISLNDMQEIFVRQDQCLPLTVIIVTEALRHFFFSPPLCLEFWN